MSRDWDSRLRRSMVRYDRTDRVLLAVLRDNSCRHLHEYACATGIAKSTLHERLHKLARSGVRFVPLIDFARAGYAIQAIFIIPYADDVVCAPCVNNASRIAPNHLLVHCVFASVRELEAFREQIGARSYYTVVDALVQEHFMAGRHEPPKHL